MISLWWGGDDRALHVLNFKTRLEHVKICMEHSVKGLIFTENGEHLLAGYKDSETLSILNPQTLQKRIGNIQPGGIVHTLTRDGKYALGLNPYSKSISFINLKTLRKEKPDLQLLGRDLRGIALTPNGKYAFVYYTNDNNVSRINLECLTQQEDFQLPLPVCHINLQLLDDETALIANYGEREEDHCVYLFNIPARKRLKNIIPVIEPTYMKITLDNKYALVATSDDRLIFSTISVINLYSWVKERVIDVKCGHFNLHLEPSGNYAFSANEKNITIIDLRTWEVAYWPLKFTPLCLTTFPLTEIEERQQ